MPQIISKASFLFRNEQQVSETVDTVNGPSTIIKHVSVGPSVSVQAGDQVTVPVWVTQTTNYKWALEDGNIVEIKSKAKAPVPAAATVEPSTPAMTANQTPVVPDKPAKAETPATPAA